MQPILVFDSSAVTLMTVTAGELGEETPRLASPGWYHAAALEYGSGRAAFFGEAAMFTAQVVGESRRKIGMNSPHASQNAQFILNLMHWLSGLSGD